MTQVTLEQVLRAREERVLRQQACLKEHRCPVVCFTMNIAGPVKTSPLIIRGFREGLRVLEARLPADCVLSRQTEISDTGCETIFSVQMKAAALKALCKDIEDSHPLGRLFDMDVLDPDAGKLSRGRHRGCIVCGEPGWQCAAGRRHGVPELQAATHRILYDFFSGQREAEEFLEKERA